MAVNQISVFLENRNGQLAEITGLLAENKINLRAISIAETADYGVLRLIADDSEKATSVLLANGNIINMNPVTVVAVPDEPAGLSELLKLLSAGDISIEYMYSLFTHQNDKAYMVFRVTDYDNFIELLSKHGLTPVSSAELGLK
ncbi:MAG: ACT domain-containing protein [Acutalibacteraceae bacterium]|nr:ACT domain-containing protein [Acutalibacteraceae bacterium]